MEGVEKVRWNPADKTCFAACNENEINIINIYNNTKKPNISCNENEINIINIYKYDNTKEESKYKIGSCLTWNNEFFVLNLAF